MARVRTGGGLAVAFTLTVIAFFFALVLAIIFASSNGKFQEDAEQARAALKNVALDNELGELQKRVPADARQTPVGYLIAETDTLKKLVSSTSGLSAEELAKNAQDMGVNLTLFEEIKRLRDEVAAAQSRAEAAEAARGQAEQTAAAARDARADLDSNYNATVADLRSQIDKVKQDFENYRNSISGSDRKAADALATLRSEKDGQVASLEQEKRQLEAENTRILNELRDATRRPEGVAGVENVVAVDGQITSVLDDEQQVYLNLGAGEKVMLGMTFEVFNASELVKTDEYDNVRGKATVEVISISDTTSLARIVRKSHRATLRPGDQIVNIVFDPQQTFKFHVYGDFDLDHNGDATEAERRLVDSMVRRWGGVLTDELTYDVDFLVLGVEPPLPDTLPPDVIDPQLIAENVAKKAAFEQYQTLIGEARTLSLPILNQNRFLALVGQYDR